ncbi:hypothetical protein [Bacillus cereus group sp. BfR-BA-01315]|nr:hypothetical protein [Bacillus cereus group sp. BfR-BA-01315]
MKLEYQKTIQETDTKKVVKREFNIQLNIDLLVLIGHIVQAYLGQ